MRLQTLFLSWDFSSTWAAAILRGKVRIVCRTTTDITVNGGQGTVASNRMHRMADQSEVPRAARTLVEYITDPTTVLPDPMSTVEAADRSAAIHNSAEGPTVGSSVSPYFGDSAGQPFFAVSVSKGLTLRLPGRFVDQRDIDDYLVDNSELFTDPRSVLGTWYDEETDTTLVDVSYLIHGRRTAEHLARRFDQIAIYSLHGGVPDEDRPIGTGGTGEVPEDPSWPPYQSRLPSLRRARNVLFDKQES